MRKQIDYSGQTFGSLFVERMGERKAGKATCDCKCLCGTMLNVVAAKLKIGHTQSCGCKRIKRDLVGKTIGIFYVESTSRNRFNQIICNCVCQCGKRQTVNSSHLRTGRAIGCNRCSHRMNCDLTGKAFGLLEVVGMTLDKRGYTGCNCICRCGRVKVVSASSLIHGDVKSCGCLVSYKEEQIAIWLETHGYRFNREATFDGCENVKRLRFDFAIECRGEIKLVEYHGSQHYRKYKSWCSLEETQYRDSLKRGYCEDWNIPLLVMDGYTKDLGYTLEWFLQS